MPQAATTSKSASKAPAPKAAPTSARERHPRKRAEPAATRQMRLNVVAQALHHAAQAANDDHIKQFGLDLDDELIVDLFAGFGGASEGIELGAGRPVNIAINHDRLAIDVHETNHPQATHYNSDVFDVEPRLAVNGRPVGLLWASPDCTYHSRARGGKPFRDRNRARRRRALASVVLKWADQVRPRIIFTENVAEFAAWAPLLADGRPDPEKVGHSFRRWVSRLRNLGYEVQWRELAACDFGAPTTRKRLFIIARCDGQPIVWPQATHGRVEYATHAANLTATASPLMPYRTAADCIDWSLPCPSIFGRKKSHAGPTLRRVAHGIVRYVLKAGKPFVVRIGHTGHGDSGKVRSIDDPLSTVTTKAEHLLVSPTLIQVGYGEREGQAPRVPGLDKPLGTVVAGGPKHALVTAFLAKHYTGVVGSSLDKPLGTVTTIDHHSLVAATLIKLRGTSNSASLDEPLHTISAQGTHHAAVYALLQAMVPGMFDHGEDDQVVTVDIEGVRYAIVDIGLRMLEPHELAAAQGFRPGFVLDRRPDGTRVPKYAQVRLVGNSVSPLVAAALVKANYRPRWMLQQRAA